jgi:DNA-binding response OmpR family regulator
MKLVTLEKDPDNPWSLANMLRQAGYHCRGYRSVNALVESPWVEECDLAIIDVDQMKLDRRLIAYLSQTFWPNRPMLFVGDEAPQPESLARDDTYLTRPISARGLVACVKAALSRTWDRYADSEVVQFGRYRFDSDGHGVRVGETCVALTQKEYLLALLLFRNLAKPVSRVYLAQSVWRHDERINARTMTAHISAIRSKLQLRGNGEYALNPIYNYGYRLDLVRRQHAPGASATQALHP